MNNRFTTIKCFTSPEKEEAWLEKMALRGWTLIRVSGFPSYTFERSEPQKRIYRVDYRSFKNPTDREDYLALFKDSGWQPVMPREVNGAFYFTSLNEDAIGDIFSDETSRAGRNLRYVRMSLLSLFPAFLPLMVLYVTGNIRFRDIGYLTPGLWQMTGSEFYFHFLFETPFVLLRGLMYFLPLVPLGLVIVFLIRYYREYRVSVKYQHI